MLESKVSSISWIDPYGPDAVYAAPRSQTLARIFRDAYGDDYPDEADPFSFVTKTDLARMTKCLAIGPGRVLVDLGCGRGGPGLWLARETGADLVGIDLSPHGIALANRRATDFGLAGRADFQVGDLSATGLPDAGCGGAISLDVLMFVSEKAEAVREAARILRSGARFALTAFEPAASDLYHSLLASNGFTVEVCEEKPDWQRRQLAVYQGTVDHQAALVEEMGGAAQFLLEEAHHFLANGLANTRHVFVVGRRL